MLAELVEDVNLLSLRIRDLKDPVGFFGRDTGADCADPIISLVRDVQDAIRSTGDRTHGRELDVGRQELILLKAFTSRVQAVAFGVLARERRNLSVCRDLADPVDTLEK